MEYYYKHFLWWNEHQKTTDISRLWQSFLLWTEKVKIVQNSFGVSVGCFFQLSICWVQIEEEGATETRSAHRKPCSFGAVKRVLSLYLQTLPKYHQIHRKQLSGTRYIIGGKAISKTKVAFHTGIGVAATPSTEQWSRATYVESINYWRGVFDAQMVVSKRWGYTAQNWNFPDNSTSGTSGNSYPTCSTTVVKSLPSFTTVFNISGIGCSSKTPSSSPSTGKLTLIALHFAVVISAVRLALER